jgi:hypothetical protein
MVLLIYCTGPLEFDTSSKYWLKAERHTSYGMSSPKKLTSYCRIYNRQTKSPAGENHAQSQRRA